MARPPVSPPDAGFSLVEVVVALVVFLLVSSAVVTLLIVGLRTVRENAERVTAAGLARAEVEALQARGAEAITPGLTEKTVTQDGVAYTVQTSATWIQVDQTADPCAAVIDPAKLSLLRLTVNVSSPGLPGPQSIAALVPRTTEIQSTGTGSVSVRVIDSTGLGVPSVGVTLRDTQTNTTFGQFQTDVNGCLIVSGITAGPSWSATIAKSGYVALSPPGLTSSKAVTGGVNTAFDTFTYAPAATLRLRSADDTYPIPAGIPARLTTPAPLTQIPAASGYPLASNSAYSYPLTVGNLFPGTYQTWLGTCSDNEATGQSAVVAMPGQTTPAILAGARVQIVAAPGTTVTMTRNAFTGTCTGGLPTYSLGSTGDDWALRVTVPFGDWTFATSGKEPFGNIQLPTSSGAACSIYWGTGLEAQTRDAAQTAATRANALIDDSNPAVTQALLLQAAQTVQGAQADASGTDAVALSKSLGRVTATGLVRIAGGRASADDSVSLTLDGQRFPLEPACNANSPVKGSP